MPEPNETPDLFFKIDDFYAWIGDGGAIMIKAVTGTDPVELTTGQVREIIESLTRMVKHADGDDDRS
jgi:hypothetical protein